MRANQVNKQTTIRGKTGCQRKHFDNLKIASRRSTSATSKSLCSHPPPSPSPPPKENPEGSRWFFFSSQNKLALLDIPEVLAIFRDHHPLHTPMLVWMIGLEGSLFLFPITGQSNYLSAAFDAEGFFQNPLILFISLYCQADIQCLLPDEIIIRKGL